MREILFRGKDKYNGEWIEGYYYLSRSKYAGDKSFVSEVHTITTGITEVSGAYGEHSETIKSSVIPETVGQYTGLTDKNGTKIFEGDIVESEWDGRKHLVEYYEDRGGYFPFACGDGCGCCETDVEIPEGTIVIGNIHDNPILLEEGD